MRRFTRLGWLRDRQKGSGSAPTTSHPFHPFLAPQAPPPLGVWGVFYDETGTVGLSCRKLDETVADFRAHIVENCHGDGNEPDGDSGGAIVGKPDPLD